MNILKLDYPTYSSQKQLTLSACFIAFLTYLFLVLFQPFGTYNYVHTNKYVLLLPYAIIALILFYIGDYYLYKYYSKWNWQKEITKNTLLLAACSQLNYVYSLYFINNTDFSLPSLFYMFVFTLALGIPICTIITLAKYSFFSSKSLSTLNIPTKTDHTASIENNILITPDAGEYLEIANNNFLYAQSEGNYCLLFYIKNDIVEKKLLRISLKKLEEQIGSPTVIRCHRSYILNVENATHKQGNAQGFKISVKGTYEKIPVSRKYLNKMSALPF